METNKKNHNHQLEINDLIDEAINNAIARRQEALESAEILSDAEAKSVTGGALINPIILGYIFKPPITIGLIANIPIVKTF
ncbi:hypothetical protein B6N60_01012 [Richelia sinica FACHB-800]|uniref:Uncharacterized protein n=1 Tax=Richelia sinica FACHB-800 TaxID=1357546 RepID=A0A975T5A0_9NOST|nr:hypothetical protein [Richelia sinica]MBD2664918.1 hypothetical protein [Richelia sinica FACHB-800]QXE22329.1 hypothetical protein B6N60_01012 [Richelia sinica FACHB-800]